VPFVLLDLRFFIALAEEEQLFSFELVRSLSAVKGFDEKIRKFD